MGFRTQGEGRGEGDVEVTVMRGILIYAGVKVERRGIKAKAQGTNHC